MKLVANDGRLWLLVSVSTAGASASARVMVWRKLRSLGSLYLHQSVCLLPLRAKVDREVRRLVQRVVEEGGSARSMRILIADAKQEQEIVEQFRAERDLEYDEVLERVPAFLEELKMERARGRASYAEVEESEADLARFRAWMAKIEARDYFGSERGAATREAVAGCEKQLKVFEAEAMAAEADGGAPEDMQAFSSDGRRRRRGPARLRAVE
jgi:hypothetical protein